LNINGCQAASTKLFVYAFYLGINCPLDRRKVEKISSQTGNKKPKKNLEHGHR
jgi:hypothetical protein